MDILTITAQEIERIVNNLNLKCEIEPTISDLKDTRLILELRSFWDEPDGYIHETNYSLEEDGDGYSTYLMNLPIKLTLFSKSSGEYWRKDFINISKELTKIFLDIKKIGVVGGKYTDEAVTRIQLVLPSFENNNAHNGLGCILELKRAPEEDIVFQKQTEVRGDNELNDGYIAQCVWNGNIVLYDGL